MQSSEASRALMCSPMYKKFTTVSANRTVMKAVNEALFSQSYSRQKIMGVVPIKTSRTTVSKYMEDHVTARILIPKKEGTEIFYINDDLIRILEQ